MIVRAAPREHLWWIQERTSCVLTPRARAIEAVDAAGRIRGMVAYDLWTLNSVTCHMAVDAPIVWRHLRGPAFSYPFEERGLGLVLGVIPAHNVRSLRMATRLGLEVVHRIKDGWAPGDDLVILQMKRDDCPWILSNRKAA